MIWRKFVYQASAPISGCCPMVKYQNRWNYIKFSIIMIIKMFQSTIVIGWCLCRPDQTRSPYRCLQLWRFSLLGQYNHHRLHLYLCKCIPQIQVDKMIRRHNGLNAESIRFYFDFYILIFLTFHVIVSSAV